MPKVLLTNHKAGTVARDTTFSIASPQQLQNHQERTWIADGHLRNDIRGLVSQMRNAGIPISVFTKDGHEIVRTRQTM